MKKKENLTQSIVLKFFRVLINKKNHYLYRNYRLIIYIKKTDTTNTDIGFSINSTSLIVILII